LAVLPGCGEPEVEPWLSLPVNLEPRAVVTYQFDWQQETHRGPRNHGKLSWSAEVSVEAGERGSSPRPMEWRFAARPDAEAKPGFAFSLDAQGVVRAVQRFQDPAGYRVTRGGVGAEQLGSAEDRVQTYVRPFPAGSLAEPSATWTVHDVSDGLPMPVGLTWTMHVDSVTDSEVVLLGTGVVVVPSVESEAASVASWLEAAEKKATARVVLSRADGLVASAEWSLSFEAERPWDADADAPPQHLSTRRLLTITRR